MPTGPLRAGELRHQVTIRRLMQTPNGSGGFIDTWDTLGTPWAKVESLAGREAVLANTLQGIASYRITIRWRADMDTLDAVKYQMLLADGTPLNIRDSSDPDGRRFRLEIMADSGSVVAE